MSKAERMVRWRESRELLDPEADAVLATPSLSGGNYGTPFSNLTLSAQSKHGTRYCTPVVHETTSEVTPVGTETQPPTSSTAQHEAVSLHLALAAASNEIDRLRLACETADALRDVAKTRVEEETKRSQSSKGREDAAEALRAEAEAAMRAAHATAKAHEAECKFLAERFFEAEAEHSELLKQEREKLKERWEEEVSVFETESLASQVREKDSETAYDDLVEVLTAERNRWEKEKQVLVLGFENEKAAWAAERAALVEALEFDDSRKLEARRAEMLTFVATAVNAERAKVFADFDLEGASHAADAAASEALLRREQRAWARREDELVVTLNETKAQLVAAEVAREAYEHAAVKAVHDAQLAEEEAREAREEKYADENVS